MERGWTLLVLGTLCLSAFLHSCDATTTITVTLDQSNPPVTAPCTFPFTYNGQSFVGCTNVDSLNTNAYWCSVDSTYAAGRWGYCPDALTAPAGASVVTPTGTCNFPVEVASPKSPFKIRFYECSNAYEEAATGATPSGVLVCQTTTGAVGTCPAAATATTSTTAAAGCTDTFVRSADSGRQGGVRVMTGTSFFTQIECEALCLASGRTNCAAYDFATIAGAPAGQRSCWQHSAASIANNAISARPNEGIDHYTRMACDAATTTPTSTPAVGSCVDTFSEMLSTNYNGGSPTSAAGNTVALCQAYCLARSECLGFDFNTAANQCWIFNGPTPIPSAPAGNPPTVNHYRRVPCNATVGGSTVCVDSFTEERAMQLFNGRGRAGLDAVACMSACLAETFCSHYELSASNQCFLHFNKTGETPARITDQNHRLFTRNPCQPTSTQPGVCRDNFTPRANTNVFGGSVRDAISSVEACTSACLSADPICTAFDFASFGNERCFLFTSTNRQYVASNDVTHYERNFRCNGTVTGPGCVESYIATANSNRQGGVRQASINTNADCAAQCGQTQQSDANACYGYDFNSGNNQCFFHIGSIPSQTGVFQGVTSYERQFVCSRSTTLADVTGVTGVTGGGGCRDVYTASANSNVFGGSGPQANANTESACRDLCSATVEGQAGYCYGYDFDSNSNQCFFILTATYDISPGANGVTHYNRRRDCPGTAVTGITCVELYNATVNRNSAGGTDIGAGTIESCSQQCNNRTDCFGFDRANGNCWLLIGDYTLNPGAANGVINYRRQFNCGGTTTGSVTGITGGVTGVTGAGCIPTYTLRSNVIVYGGVDAPAGSDTVAACAGACNADTNCVAYNFDKVSASAKCFLLRGSVGTENPNNDLDLYIQDNNCAGVTTPSVSQCRMELLGAGNVNGGTFVPNTNTLAACQTWCIENEPCQAVDWDATTNQCFWFTTTSTTASGSSCCQHFNKVCENTCTDSFNSTVGVGYFGGMEVLNRPTVMDCQTACLERELCAAFDFNSERGQCFTLLLSNLDRSYTFAGVTNYRRIRCPSGTPGRTTLPTTIRTTACPDRYTALANTNGLGGTEDRSVNNVAACQRACTADPLCTALDFDGGRCFRHTGTPTLNRGTSIGVTHYQRRPCQDTATPSPVTITPSPQVCNLDIFFFVDAIDPNLLDQMGLVIQQIAYGTNVGNVRFGVRSFGESNTQLFQYATIENFIVASVSAIRTLIGPNNLPGALQQFLSSEYPNSLAAGREVLIVIMSDLNVAQRYIGALNSQRAQLQGIQTIMVTFNNVLDPNRNAANAFANSRRQIFHQNGQSITTANDILSNINVLCRSNRNLTPRPSVVTNCLADIALVLDNSLGSSSNDWNLVRAFASSIVDQIAIGTNDNRVAIVTMDNGGTRWADLDDYRTAADLKGVINAVPSARSGVTISNGLRAARQQVFTQFSGDRSNIKNVVIILSRNRDSGDTSGEANALKQTGTALVAIGLRNLADENLLRFVVSGDQSNYISIGSLLELPSVLRSVIQKACAATQNPVNPTPAPVTPAPVTPAPTPIPNPSQCKADLVIVLDDSGSIRDSNKAGQPDNYDTMKTFTQDLIDLLNVGESSTRVAVITYSNVATTHMYLGDYYDRPSIKRVLADLPYTGGNTNTTGALRQARTDVMLTPRRDRPSVRNVVLLVTDGTTTREVNGLVPEANTIKSSGTVIFGVGITDNVNAAEMSSIITAQDYYLQVANFADLSTLSRSVSELICRAVN